VIPRDTGTHATINILNVEAVPQKTLVPIKEKHASLFRKSNVMATQKSRTKIAIEIFFKVCRTEILGISIFAPAANK
jgi:hypothetical protein